MRTNLSLGFLSLFLGVSIVRAPAVSAVHPASAAYPYECGNVLSPTSSGITAADAFLVLKIAVGQTTTGSTCSLCYCDASRDGKVAAVDALYVLRRAVGSLGELSCYSDIENHPEEPCTPCHQFDQADLERTTEEVFHRLNGRVSTSQVLSSGTNIFWQCESGTVVKLDEEVWGSTGPANTQNNIEISGIQWGEDKGLVFERSPLCYDSEPCPDIDNEARFLRLGGSGQSVKSLTIHGFYEGIHLAGVNATLDDMYFDRQCDDSVSTISGSGYGSVLQNSAVTGGCDKCIQLHKGGTTPYNPGSNPRPTQCTLPQDSNGTSPNRGCYHLSIVDTDFIGCKKPVKVSLGDPQGNGARFYMENVDVTEFADDKDTTVSNVFACSGTESEGNNVVGDFVEYKTFGCDGGLSLGGVNSKYTVQGKSVIQKSDKKGLLDYATGATNKLTVRNSVLYDNGGWATTSAPLGGLGIGAGALADLGLGGSNPGNTKYCCNRNGQNTADRDIHNDSGFNVSARGNYYCGDVPAIHTNCVPATNCGVDTAEILSSDPVPGVSTSSCSSRMTRP